MDDLQRRLRGMDPLTASTGSTHDASRLDALRERIMTTDVRTARTPFRRGRTGLVGLAAGTLAMALLVGSLARPSTPALAWSPEPTPATDAQKVAAAAACADGAAQAAGSGRGDASESVTPSAPPPLVGLELHGTGAIAILADATDVGYCLLRSDGDAFVYGGLVYGLPEAASAGSLVLGGMSTEFAGSEVGLLFGAAPEGVTSVRLDGGPGDGGVATIAEGRFAIWIPGSVTGSEIEVVGLDETGTEVVRQVLPIGEKPSDGTPTRAP